ncbi:MAG: (E)-4-hydroxy-3-methylbut-2-enyl-diphosphate synthase [Myxococcota bacterium]
MTTAAPQSGSGSEPRPRSGPERGRAGDPPASFDPFRPVRRRTRVVAIGDVRVGGDEPIRIQSMTNTNTLDTQATVEQTVRLAQAGCEIVRITAPSIRDAENLREIKRALAARGVSVPLVADIHFTPNAAMIAAEIVEKVRINPGNYADKKRFEIREYDDAEYAEELERVAARFRPLVLRCKQNGVALRIGTNHGSLSDRIMNRFGDTPQGMVESALEFLDVCEGEGFRDVVFSMKSSNTQVAIAAYRLLAARLEERAPGEPSYPFHVGVTEAGDAEDGRIKSAIGIGALLEDGLGDTIRVSLTEDPVREIPVAREIARAAGRAARAGDAGMPGRRAGAADDPIPVSTPPFANPFAHARRATRSIRFGNPGQPGDPGGDLLEIGGEAPVRVELDRADALLHPAETAAQLAVELASLRDVACESLLVSWTPGAKPAALERLGRELASLGLALPISLRVRLGDPSGGEALGSLGNEPPLRGLARIVGRVGLETAEADLLAFVAAVRRAGAALEWELEAPMAAIPQLVRRLQPVMDEGKTLPAGADREGSVPIFSLAPGASPHAVRVLAAAVAEAQQAAAPIVLRPRIGGSAAEQGLSERALVELSVLLGASLCDGIGDLVSLSTSGSPAAAVDVAYRILQGARLRTTRTEYISCPSCGRTLFDLEETTARIKARTDHLSGVKIAVMGCIVNGPGEMADADFGYVGSGVGQVTLYVGKQVVERAVPEAEAPDRLVALIRSSGRWLEPA